jgi:maltodextrin utilization protein YvdJ
MNKTLLWGLAAVCNFVSAALTYVDNGRFLIIAIQVLAGVLMIVAAFKKRSN